MLQHIGRVATLKLAPTNCLRYLQTTLIIRGVELVSEFLWRIVASSIYSGSSSFAGLQLVIQSTQILKNCYLLLSSNPHHSSKILSPKYCRCMQSGSLNFKKIWRNKKKLSLLSKSEFLHSLSCSDTFW